MSGTYQLLVYADGVILMHQNIFTINIKTLYGAVRDVVHGVHQEFFTF